MTDRLRALLAAATPGPWKLDQDFYGVRDVIHVVDGKAYPLPETNHDAALIVYLRNTAEAREAVIEAARFRHYPKPLDIKRCVCGFIRCSVAFALAVLDAVEKGANDDH